MKVAIRGEGDRELLDALIAGEKDATQGDRLRAVRLALDGEQAVEIAEALGRSRRFVQGWAYASATAGSRRSPQLRRPP
ncbi:MAG: hypothetical protein JWP03_2258 [Phycisphaerales bacterium]|nr:hypothetical protein [Phycisphaerales bacterium]